MKESTSQMRESGRTRLLSAALEAVQRASSLHGVLRIALIGSLATPRPEPKDVDLLVTVADEVDLAPLARVGRRLAGRAQNLGLGGEIFLVDPAGRYLGRTCPWTACAPGIRTRCDALHCGRRPHLHDDLRTITLRRELIAEPPIELWPVIQTRVAVPQDVEEWLLRPLQEALRLERREAGSNRAFRINVPGELMRRLEATGIRPAEAVRCALAALAGLASRAEAHSGGSSPGGG